MIRLLTALIFLTFAGTFASPLRAQIEIQEVTSPGGITAWLVEERGIPFVALELRIRGGTSLDLPGKRGAINLMAGLLEEGAGDMDAQSFQAKREALAASFGFRVSDDTFSLSVKVLSENRDEAMALLRLALIEPRFDEDAIERVRAQVISGLRSDEKNPRSLASSRLDALTFGPHPYGTNPDGTLESVADLTRDDLLAAQTNVLVRDGIYVGVVGDISAEELGILLDDLLSDLPAEGPDMPADISYDLAGGLSVVEYDTPQSVVLFSQSGMKRDDDDFFAAHLLNTILGGPGFENRLMEEVREKRGLTYGISTFLVPKFHAELMIGSVASANDRIAETIEVVREEWLKMARDGVSAEELALAKTYITGEYPLRFDGNGRIAGILVGMQMTGLPMDYILTRNDKMNAVTLEEINRVARELLDPEGLFFVVVGQPEGLTPSE